MTISRLYDFTSGTTIQSGQVDAELNQLVTAVNQAAAADANNAFTGNNTFSNTNTFEATASFSGATGLKADVIAEYTGATGVTIDSVRLKDGMVKVSGTPTQAGEIGYASNKLTFYNGSTVKELDIDSMLPSQTSNSGKILTTNGTTTSWTTGPAFTAYNLSSNVTITAGGAWSVTHGLGAAPKGIQLWLKCTTTDLNYAVGDMVAVSSDNAHGTNDLGAGAAVLTGNTTTINGRFGSSASTFFIPDKSSGVNSGITNSKWALVVASWT